MNSPLRLEADEALAFARVCCDLLAVVSRERLEDLLTGTDFQALLPFGAAVVGVGVARPQGVTRFEIIPVHFPEAHLHYLRQPESGLASPMIRLWLERREPVLFDLDHVPPGLPEDWLASFRSSGLDNCLAHGVHDFSSDVSSYFAFCRLPRLSSRHADLLRLLAPHLHEAVIRLTASALRGGTAAAAHLTPREREMLSWLYLGKTNWEIGCILGISEKTVKNRMSAVFDKLGASNRTQLLVKISEMGLLG